jgi:hypothetical protein
MNLYCVVSEYLQLLRVVYFPQLSLNDDEIFNPSTVNASDLVIWEVQHLLSKFDVTTFCSDQLSHNICMLISVHCYTISPLAFPMAIRLSGDIYIYIGYAHHGFWSEVIILSRVFVTIDGVRLANGFIDHLYTRLGTTNKYNAIANLHTLQLIRAHAKFSQAVSLVISW